ncbi:NAD(P)/FAD-dependent oxidoreductase [Pseudoprimorskyibacter insulae]|uniref:FAD-dependent catabolic D-arginine dehydrogenase DauA n=1 Tax=Pseudoprimorskyibacter insulae TaxID=1695997 RepID=A0A2R8AVE2_9RHOB|nr:FAD-binding oxidoreductase [Pseudoprimorskyibacter insulae]SPF79995.1 FAD-dependent catabolic D-arginine dehydrogenase DauA [Pseudoprimorskyibacter insulae]
MEDIVIIGGGIAGLSAAASVSPFARVTVLEAESQTGYHSSGRSAAAFLPDYGSPAVREMNYASYAPLAAIPDVLSPRSLMLVGKAGQEDQFRSEAADLHLETLSLDEARSIVPILNPDTCAHVALRDGVHDIDTDLLMQHFIRLARMNDTDIVRNARVDTISHYGKRWVITAGDRTWQADTVINAAGAWVDRVAAMAGIPPIGFRPLRRSMARIALPDRYDATRWPFIESVGEQWYAKPDAGALLVSPAEEDLVEPHDAWADDMVLAEGLARYEEMVTEPVARMISNWAGLRTQSPDRSLVIGRDPAVPSFFWLGGQGGYGFLTCCAASSLTAALLAGFPPELAPASVAALAPDRFR